MSDCIKTARGKKICVPRSYEKRYTFYVYLERYIIVTYPTRLLWWAVLSNGLCQLIGIKHCRPYVNSRWWAVVTNRLCQFICIKHCPPYVHLIEQRQWFLFARGYTDGGQCLATGFVS
ncbi:MAG: hypothetical protein F6K52_28230 [Moorea sp. SIO3H5]|nr:hypothetical protein [Moorena sp. SIO3H5]